MAHVAVTGAKKRINLPNAVTTGIATAAMALSLSPAEAAAHNPEKQTTAAKVAKALKNRIVKHNRVNIDSDDYYVWFSRGNKTTGGVYPEVTRHEVSTPLVANVNGEKRVFGLVQRGETLQSLKVVPVPARAEPRKTEYAYYHCGAEPVSTKGIVELDRYATPVTEIANTHGERHDVLVGQFYSKPGDEPFMPGPPLPPNYCEGRTGNGGVVAPDDL